MSQGACAALLGAAGEQVGAWWMAKAGAGTTRRMVRNHPPVASRAPGDGLRKAWLPARAEKCLPRWPRPRRGRPRPRTGRGAHRQAAGRRGRQDLPRASPWRSGPANQAVNTGRHRQEMHVPPQPRRRVGATCGFFPRAGRQSPERGRGVLVRAAARCPIGQAVVRRPGRKGARTDGPWLAGRTRRQRPRRNAVELPWCLPPPGRFPLRGFSPAGGLAMRGRHRERSPRRARPRRNRTAAGCATAAERKPRHGRPA
jgi:hypothetical protein